MLCSTVWQSESALHIHTSPIFSISFPFTGFPCGSDSKEAACNAGDQSLIPGLGSSLENGMATTPVDLPGEFHGYRSVAGYSPWGLRVGQG